MSTRMLCAAVLAVLLAACASQPERAQGYLSVQDTTKRRARAIEFNRVEAARVASGEARDPWRHARPYDRP